MIPESIAATELTGLAFAPFGDVIEARGAPDQMINADRCGRYHNLANLSFAASGTAGISVFRSEPITLPLTLDLIERHPLGSQCFIPMSGSDYLVVVADNDKGTPVNLQAFRARPDQGVNYHRNTWHAVLMPLGKEAFFTVVDWIGAGNNLEEYRFKNLITVTATQSES